jgi:hypothetical protein
MSKDTNWFVALIRRSRDRNGETELAIEHVTETPGFIARTLTVTKTRACADADRMRLQFPMQCAPAAMDKLRPDLNTGTLIQPEFTVRGPKPKSDQVIL